MEGSKVYANPALLRYILFECQENYLVLGRGAAKTSGFHAWDQKRKAIAMPGSKGLFVHDTYQQALVRTVPSLIAGLRRIGVYKDVHYVIGERPDKKLGFADPIEPPVDGYRNCMVFKTGRIMQIISLDIKGSAAGINSDDISGDEVKYWDKKKFDEEVLPTMRANESLFGHLPMHWSINLTTSMPTSADGKWILKIIDQAKDPESYNGKKLILIEDYLSDKVALMAKLANQPPETVKRLQYEIAKIDRQLDPLRFGTRYVDEADSLSNISVLTERYIRRMKRVMDHYTFLSEILNQRPLTVDKCFYADLDIDKHTYPSAFNNQYLEGLNWDFAKAKKQTCLQDGDCLPEEPLHISVDWGAVINSMTVGHYFSPTSGHPVHRINPINSLFVTHPDGIDDLADQFAAYYQPHHNKEYYLHHDPKTGWEKRPNNRAFPTYAEQFMSRLSSHGWTCIYVTPRGTEMPTHHTRYGLWKKVLRREDPALPELYANLSKCKLTLNSMLNTPIKEDHRGISKNKSSEKTGSGVLPQEATHFGDTMDIWLVDIVRGAMRNREDFVDLMHL